MSQPWVTGDEITARRLEEMRLAGMLPKTQQMAVGGAYSVGGMFGMRGAGLPNAYGRLCYATENFSRKLATDTASSDYDQSPSGTCRPLVLDTRYDSATATQYVPESREELFRCYDPIGGMLKLQSIRKGFPFYARYNEESQRWEVIRDAFEIRHGIVCRCIGRGWYIVELKNELVHEPPFVELACEYPSSSSSSLRTSSDIFTDPCDICDLTYYDGQDLNTYCGTDGVFYPYLPARPIDGSGTAPNQVQVTGTGEYVYAYDKRAIRLKEGGEVTIVFMGDVANPWVSTGSTDRTGEDDIKTIFSDEAVKVYNVLNGEYDMVQIVSEQWDCVDGVETRLGCVTFLVEGTACVKQETSGSSEGSWF